MKPKHKPKLKMRKIKRALVKALADYFAALPFVKHQADDDPITGSLSDFLCHIDTESDCTDPRYIRQILPLQFKLIEQRARRLKDAKKS